MFHWVPYPFVRIVAALIAGITLGIYFPGCMPVNLAIGLLIILSIIFGILYIFRKKINSLSEWAGLLGLSLIFLMGYIHLFYKTDRNQPSHLLHQQDTIQYYTAMVVSQPQEKENSWKVEARMQWKLVKEWERGNAKLILYLSKQDFDIPYKYGDILLLRGMPDVVAPPGNPHAFDYQRYLSFQNIYHQQYVRKDDVQFVKSAPPNPILQVAIDARVWAGNTLKKYVTGEQEQAIVLGLVLGIKDGLDNELISAYAASGGMHVLAVSGLHVGIIYWIVLLVLRPIANSGKGLILTSLISMIILWGYAMITGMSPSVLRAVTMFTFVALAVPWRQRTNIYNTLAISAGCLLLYDPYLIMAVGFQLSYSAVLGIVYFQPILNRALTSRYYLINKIWELTSVSIAAQMATGALSVLYFHQFPVYFLISNLFIIPCAFIILIGGLGILICSFLGTVATGIGAAVSWVIKLLNSSVFYIESFPGSLIENIYLTTFQCWLVILMMLALIALFELKKFRYLIVTFMLVSIFSIQQGFQLIKNRNRQQLVVYAITGHSAFDILERGTVFTFMDSILANDAGSIRFNIYPNRLPTHSKKIVMGQELEISRKVNGGMVVKRNSITLFWITGKNYQIPVNVNIDFIVISNNAVTSLANFNRSQQAIIIDSSNSSYLAKKLTSQAGLLGLKIHNTRVSGAFIVEQNLE